MTIKCYTPDLAGSGQFGICDKCKKPPSPEGHDGCLGVIPGDDIMNACCGHGLDKQAYIQFWDGLIIRGSSAVREQQKRLKNNQAWFLKDGLMFEKAFYKMQLVPEEDGLTIWTEVFLSIHETACFHVCIREIEKGFFSPVLMGNETPVKYAKRKGRKTFRIHKKFSRIAFDTPEKAFEDLLYLKGRQIAHLERQLEFNRCFLEKIGRKSFDKLKNRRTGWPVETRGLPTKVIDGTQELVNKYLRFE